MKKIITSALLMATVLGGAAALAADIDGKWQGMAGQNTMTFVLKADGEKLTGTIENSQSPGAVDIHDGKISGSEISFNLTRQIQGAETKIEWTGKLEGGELKLKRGAMGGGAGGPGGGAGAGMNAEVVAKRVVEEKK